MNYPKYDLTTSTDHDIFEFLSMGVKGNIKKLIQFEATLIPKYYNLAFGDKKCGLADTPPSTRTAQSFSVVAALQGPGCTGWL